MNESTIGDRFVERFYTTMDSARSSVRNFYTDSAAILWNGNAMLLPQFVEFLATFPPTTNTVQSWDTQPILGGSILVTVKGVVKLGDQGTRQFAQAFTLVPVATGKPELDYFVANDSYRFV